MQLISWRLRNSRFHCNPAYVFLFVPLESYCWSHFQLQKMLPQTSYAAPFPSNLPSLPENSQCSHWPQWFGSCAPPPIRWNRTDRNLDSLNVEMLLYHWRENIRTSVCSGVSHMSLLLSLNSYSQLSRSPKNTCRNFSQNTQRLCSDEIDPN